MFMPTFFIKFIELVIAIACLVLQQYSYDLTDVPTLVLCSGTYVGFILVISGEIIGEMVFAPLDVVQDVYFGLLGMAMFASCSWILYSSRSDPERSPRTDEMYQLYAAGLALLNVIVMLCDLRVSSVVSDMPCRTCEMISNKQDPFVEAWWSGASAVLFGACAARTLYDWRYIPDCPRREHARASAMCALATTSVLIVDAIRVLCSDDGLSSASSHDKKKPNKARAPKMSLDLTAAHTKSPMGDMTSWNNARLIPAKVPLREIPGNAGNKMGFDVPNAKAITGFAPKLSPQKIPLKKFPAVCKPLRMAPKVNRPFW